MVTTTARAARAGTTHLMTGSRTTAGTTTARTARTRTTHRRGGQERDNRENHENLNDFLHLDSSLLKRYAEQKNLNDSTKKTELFGLFTS